VGRLFRAAWLAGYYPALGDLARVKADLDRLDDMDITALDSEPELIYVFKHIVTHEVTYESLPFATRAKMHEKLAAYLESQVVAGALRELSLVDVLVFHYTRSNNQMKQREYLRKAVQAAVEVGAYTTAAKYLTRLVEITPADAPERFAQTVQLATLYKDWGDYGAARIILRKAQVAATTDADRATALALLGETMSQLGDYAEAQTLLAEATSLARASGDSLALCSALYAAGDLSWRLGKLTDAKVALNESLALARALGNVRRELPVLNLLATMMRQEDDTTESERIYEEVHTRALAAGNRLMAMVVLNNLGTVATHRRDYMAAHDHFEKALALAHETGAQQRAALYLLNRADIEIKLSKIDAARVSAREGLELALRSGVPPFVVFAVTIFAELAHAEGQVDWALSLLGLARRQPAWDSESQSDLDAMLAEWELDPAVVEGGMAKGAGLDWQQTIKELLGGGNQGAGNR
jgi:tetratricopeptide (TPR) repeat protein